MTSTQKCREHLRFSSSINPTPSQGPSHEMPLANLPPYCSGSETLLQPPVAPTVTETHTLGAFATAVPSAGPAATPDRHLVSFRCLLQESIQCRLFKDRRPLLPLNFHLTRAASVPVATTCFLRASVSRCLPVSRAAVWTCRASRAPDRRSEHG